MQPTVVQPNNIEVSSQNNGEWIRTLPVELSNTIPETLWTTLSLDQKKEILRQNGLLEKYSGNNQAQVEQPAIQSVSIEQSPDVFVEQVQKQEVSPEFQKAIEEFKEETKKPEQEESKPILSKEEIARVEAEKANNANTGGATYKFFGYQPSQNIYTNAKQISDDGDVVDAKTWAATLIAKIFGIFER